MKNSKKLIILLGPTGVGKSDLSVFLAQHLKIEIISFDSRQFYKELKIGTASPSLDQLKSAKHHFIGHLSIHQTYNVGDFQREALSKIEELFLTYTTVLAVGGSGLYEKSITESLDDFPETSQAIREELIFLWKKDGIGPLQKELKNKDPDYYKKVDLANPHRLIRSLEVIRSTGKPFSSFLNKNSSSNKSTASFEVIKLGINLPREELYGQINRRVDEMIGKGLLQEAKVFYPYRHLNALQTVGYRELFKYFDKAISLEEALEEIKKNTRRYAKRQLTWYRKDPSIKWFSPSQREDIVSFIEDFL